MPPLAWLTKEKQAMHPLLTLNGVQIPAIGLGVFQSPPEQTAGAVESALAHGDQLVDTAASYFNEA
jgi:diketogulonate reductase-like aldo/keto reductase